MSDSGVVAISVIFPLIGFGIFCTVVGVIIYLLRRNRIGTVVVAPAPMYVGSPQYVGAAYQGYPVAAPGYQAFPPPPAQSPTYVGAPGAAYAAGAPPPPPPPAPYYQ